MLRAWALAWDGGAGNADLIPPELPDDPATFVLARRSADGHVVAGAVASRSDQPVVGYEHGEDLNAAIRNGFETIGPLRIWLQS